MNAIGKGLLGRVIGFSLHFRGVVLVLATVLIGFGLYSLSRAKYDVFPEFAPPQVVIQTEAPGLAPEQVEVLVTQLVENSINGVPGIESLRSNSIQGLSVVTATFGPSSDIYRNRQVIAERLTSLTGQLPQGVQPPLMTPLTSSTSVVLAIGLTSDKQSLMDLRTLADWTIKQQLLAVPGVAKVAVFGGEAKQLQIQIVPERLIQYKLSVGEVLAAARNATGVRGAGFVDNPNQRIVLQTEGQALTPQALAKTVVLHQNGSNITLGDVAKIVEAPEQPIGAASIMGKAGVQIVISEQYGANTLEVTQRVEAALQALQPAIEAQGVVKTDLFRPANFIQIATDNVKSSLMIGAVLVVIVLFLFLFNFRTALISIAAIPLSLLAAVTVIEYLGYSLNTMTLGGLAIAIGLLVDDAVITVENIFRRLRENSERDQPQPVLGVILTSTWEVRSAVVYATLAIALVFVPVLTMSGIAGRLFAPLGVAYIVATLASLVVALTVTPALCLTLLGSRRLAQREPPVVRWSKTKYGEALTSIEKHHKSIIIGVVVLTVATLATLPYFGGGFIPELKEGHFIVHMSAVPGTSLQESQRLGRQVTQELLKLPFVRAVGQRVGRAEKADDTWGTHYSEMNVDLKPLQGDAAESAQADIRKALAAFPGVNFAVKTFLTERIEETLSGYTASVVVNVYGNDLDTLDAKAQEVAKTLGRVPGATEVQVQSPPGTPQLMVRLRPDQIARWGLTSVEVLDVVRTAFDGESVGQTYDGNRVFGVTVILDPSRRRTINDVGALPLRNPDGIYLQLRQLADIYQTSGRYIVLHNGARRVQTITANVSGRDVNSFVADARAQITSSVKLPAGSYVEFTGAAAAQAQSTHDLIVHSLLAGIALILLLSMVMGSGRNLLLVLVNLPFALVGGILAVFAGGGWLSIGSMVGFVTLFGITLRNSIMMLSHYEYLVTGEGMVWGPEAAIRGASERLVPILMTALVTALGLLPLAIGAGDPGREIEGPMALVILGGLFTSTALNLLVMPGLALRYGRFDSENGGAR
ncbi:MAG: efflux RND transporter permease subunit [Rugosibacter sp.]|nr:MAG: efflux RND transporter permease subunit [Rugosibacter sp.]